MKLMHYRILRGNLEHIRDDIENFSTSHEIEVYADDVEYSKIAHKILTEAELDLYETIVSSIFKVETLIDQLYLDQLDEFYGDKEKEGEVESESIEPAE